MAYLHARWGIPGGEDIAMPHADKGMGGGAYSSASYITKATRKTKSGGGKGVSEKKKPST